MRQTVRWRWLLRLAMASAVAVSTASSAQAAVWLSFDPPKGPPGTTVRAHTLGPSMKLIPSGSLNLFFAPNRIADAVESPGDARLTPIGELRADDADVGRIVFKVPDLPPGTYMTVAYCESCAGTVFTIGPFRVTEGGPPPAEGGRPPVDSAAESESRTTPWAVPAAVAGVMLVVAVAILLVGHRRRSASN